MRVKQEDAFVIRFDDKTVLTLETMQGVVKLMMTKLERLGQGREGFKIDFANLSKARAIGNLAKTVTGLTKTEVEAVIEEAMQVGSNEGGGMDDEEGEEEEDGEGAPGRSWILETMEVTLEGKRVCVIGPEATKFRGRGVVEQYGLVGEIAAAMDDVMEQLREQEKGREGLGIGVARSLLGECAASLGQFVEGGLSKAPVDKVVAEVNRKIQAGRSGNYAGAGQASWKVQVEVGPTYKDGERVFIKVVDVVEGGDIGSKFRAMEKKLGVMKELKEMLVALGTKDGREVTFKRKNLATRHGNIDTRIAHRVNFVCAIPILRKINIDDSNVGGLRP